MAEESTSCDVKNVHLDFQGHEAEEGAAETSTPDTTSSTDSDSSDDDDLGIPDEPPTTRRAVRRWYRTMIQNSIPCLMWKKGHGHHHPLLQITVKRR
jgi:hypothetical protein